MMKCTRRVELVLVHAEDEGGVGVLGRRGDDDARRTGFEVLARLLALGVLAGRLDDDIDPELVPGELLRVRYGQHLDPSLADDHLVAVDRDRLGVATVDRVPGEEPRERLGRPRSLIATISKSCAGSSAERSSCRPVRPNPLIASRTVIAPPLHRPGGIVRSPWVPSCKSRRAGGRVEGHLPSRNLRKVSFDLWLVGRRRSRQRRDIATTRRCSTRRASSSLTPCSRAPAESRSVRTSRSRRSLRCSTSVLAITGVPSGVGAGRRPRLAGPGKRRWGDLLEGLDELLRRPLGTASTFVAPWRDVSGFPSSTTTTATPLRSTPTTSTSG